jgi:hypothetical protein
MSDLIQTATIDAVDDSRLRDLAARYEIYDAEVEDATSRFEELKTAIKTELWARAPGVKSAGALLKDQQIVRINLWVPGTLAFQLEARSRWSLDSKKMKAEDPATYAKWAKRGIVWYLTH